MEKSQTTPHSLCIKGVTTVTGVTQVVAIEEKEVRLVVGAKSLLITGRGLSAERLSLEEGILVLSGEVSTVRYTEKSEPRSFLKRIFK